MGETTDISWCDHTFNPWHGCVRVSPGCTNCYMFTFLVRIGKAEFLGPAKTASRRTFGVTHWEEPLRWNRKAEQAGERRRVFCASMADVFEDHPHVVSSREKLWHLIRLTPNLDWLLLTKRPENIARMLPGGYWPNVWLGTSTEDQQRADERVPVLLRHRDQVPVLFLSVEPQLGPIDLWSPRFAHPDGGLCSAFAWGRGVNWVITGGESGPKHRPFDLNWARQTRDECRAAGVAWHFKQVGGLHHAAGGCLIDGREWKEFPSPTREGALA